MDKASQGILRLLGPTFDHSSLRNRRIHPSLHAAKHPHTFPGHYLFRKKAFVSAITVLLRPFQENPRVYYYTKGRHPSGRAERLEWTHPGLRR